MEDKPLTEESLAKLRQFFDAALKACIPTSDKGKAELESIRVAQALLEDISELPTCANKLAAKETIERNLNFAYRRHPDGFSSEESKDALINEYVNMLENIWPTIPITEERLEVTVRAFVNKRREIDEMDLSEYGEERAKAPIIAALQALTTLTSNPATRRKFSQLCKKFKRKTPFPSGKRKKKGRSDEDPKILLMLADLLHQVPEFWETDFVRRVLIDNECFDVLYRTLSRNPDMLVQEAIHNTIEPFKEKDHKLYMYLVDLFSEIQAVDKEWFHISLNNPDNQPKLFQFEAVLLYRKNKEPFIFIFDEPGTRKTATSVVALVNKLIHNGYKDARILAVVPKNSTWEEEILKRMDPSVVAVRDIHKAILHGEELPPYSSDAPFKIDLIAHPYFSNKKQDFSIFPDYDAALIDEGHNFKQRDDVKDSIRSHSILDFLKEKQIKYRVIITGTPAINDASEYINLLNDFGNPVVDKEKALRIPDALHRGTLIHFWTGSTVIRRRKDSILNLPPLTVETRFLDLGRKELDRAIELCHSLPDLARFEALQKIEMVLDIMMDHSNDKILNFFNFVAGLKSESECGIIKAYFEACPPCFKKIYIAGDGIIDINGEPLDYNRTNAQIVRNQFKDSKVPTVAYVSFGTCKESVCEFVSASVVIQCLLPYEASSYEQSKSRADREGSTEPVTCYISVARYRKPDGTIFRDGGKTIKTFDENALDLIKQKQALMNATCDGVKRDLDGSLLKWTDFKDKPFEDVMSLIRHAKEKTLRITESREEGVALAQKISSLQKLNQSYDQHCDWIKNELSKKEFERIEKFKTAGWSKRTVNSVVCKLFKDHPKIRMIHVGSGATKLPEPIRKKCKKLYRVDRFYQARGVINKDRSEVHEVATAVDCIAATNLLHWSPNTDNLNDTLVSFNEALAMHGYCLITAPYDQIYPFATNKKLLKDKGFKLVKEYEVTIGRYYLLQKVGEAKNQIEFAKRLLPKAAGIR